MKIKEEWALREIEKLKHKLCRESLIGHPFAAQVECWLQGFEFALEHVSHYILNTEYTTEEVEELPYDILKIGEEEVKSKQTVIQGETIK